MSNPKYAIVYLKGMKPEQIEWAQSKNIADQRARDTLPGRPTWDGALIVKVVARVRTKMERTIQTMWEDEELKS